MSHKFFPKPPFVAPMGTAAKSRKEVVASRLPQDWARFAPGASFIGFSVPTPIFHNISRHLLPLRVGIGVGKIGDDLAKLPVIGS